MKTLYRIYIAVKEHEFFWGRLFLLLLSSLLIACGLIQGYIIDVIAGAFFAGMIFMTIVDEVAERVADLELEEPNKGDL